MSRFFGVLLRFSLFERGALVAQQREEREIDDAAVEPGDDPTPRALRRDAAYLQACGTDERAVGQHERRCFQVLCQALEPERHSAQRMLTGCVASLGDWPPLFQVTWSSPVPPQ